MIKHSRQFPIIHSETFVRRQLNVARSKMELLPVAVKAGMSGYLNTLDRRITDLFGRGRTVEFGSDHVLEAELAVE